MPCVQPYVELYSGPEFLVHVRYSTIMVSVTIALLFGAALPVLYIICGLTLLAIWIEGRISVCYFYREPPAFDDKMTTACLNILKISALWGLAFSFWILGNRQIFENYTSPLITANQIRLSGHTIE
jgi:hypothetical protein